MEIKRNKKQVRKRKFYPGYVMVDMVVDNETYWAIRNTPGVAGFLTIPFPASSRHVPRVPAGAIRARR